MFVPIRAETSLAIDHQENVGKKREKRKYGTAQEKALHQILSEFHKFSEISSTIHIVHTENLKKILGCLIVRTKTI